MGKNAQSWRKIISQLFAFIFLIGMFFEKNLLWIIIIPIISFVIFIFVYSYWLYKKEGEKRDL